MYKNIRKRTTHFIYYLHFKVYFKIKKKSNKGEKIT